MPGKRVSELVNTHQAAANYTISFDVSTLPSGLYIYRLSVGGVVKNRKMLLI